MNDYYYPPSNKISTIVFSLTSNITEEKQTITLKFCFWSTYKYTYLPENTISNIIVIFVMCVTASVSKYTIHQLVNKLVNMYKIILLT